MNVIYDISPIGSDPSRRAGLARVAESMGEALVDTLGPEQGDEIQRGYHAESDCLVMNLRREQNLFRLD